jgi:hypothetical protein
MISKLITALNMQDYPPIDDSRLKFLLLVDGGPSSLLLPRDAPHGISGGGGIVMDVDDVGHLDTESEVGGNMALSTRMTYSLRLGKGKGKGNKGDADEDEEDNAPPAGQPSDAGRSTTHLTSKRKRANSASLEPASRHMRKGKRREVIDSDDDNNNNNDDEELRATQVRDLGDIEGIMVSFSSFTHHTACAISLDTISLNKIHEFFFK